MKKNNQFPTFLLMLNKLNLFTKIDINLVDYTYLIWRTQKGINQFQKLIFNLNPVTEKKNPVNYCTF
jgi:hypothetical protein